MIDAKFVLECIKRKWKAIVAFTLCAALVGFAMSLPKVTEAMSPRYTAEAIIYLNGMESDAVNEYNYSLNEGYLTSDAKKIILSDSVAGEVRRELGEDIEISSPIWTDRETRREYYSHFVFVDATAASKEQAVDAASSAANKAIEIIEESLPVQEVYLYEDARIKSSGDMVADYGVDSLEPSTGELLTSSFNGKKFIVVAGAGFLLSIFCCIMWEVVRRRIRSAHDVERILDIPVLGLVDSHGDDKKAFGRVAASIDLYADRKKRPKVVVCDISSMENASFLLQELGKRTMKASMVGCISLSGMEGSCSALLDADALVVSVAEKNSATGRDIDSALEFLALTETPVIGAIYVGSRAFEDQ